MWSYSGDPSRSNLDQLRFILGDTDPDDPQFQDEELQYLLNKYGSVEKAAIEACKLILTKVAKEVSYRVGPESVSLSDKYKHYKDLLAELTKPGVAYPLGEFNDPGRNRIRPIFDIGMTDDYNTSVFEAYPKSPHDRR